MQAILDYSYTQAESAAYYGMEPLIWLGMALGFLFKFYAFVDQLVQPFISLSVFVLSIRGVLKGQLFIFMSIFLLFISAFVFTLM